MNYKNFPKLVKEQSEIKKLSQSNLAAASGVCRNTISEIERDITNPRLENVRNILDALGYELVFIPKNILEEYEKLYTESEGLK